MSKNVSKVQDGPWTMRCTQMTQDGKLSRPVIYDARGDKVSFNRLGNAKLISLAPEMYTLLTQIDSDVYLQLGLIRGEHPGYRDPTWVKELQRLLASSHLKVEVKR